MKKAGSRYRNLIKSSEAKCPKKSQNLPKFSGSNVSRTLWGMILVIKPLPFKEEYANEGCCAIQSILNHASFSEKVRQ